MNQGNREPQFADVTLTFLEMHDRPSRSRPLPDGTVIRRIESPTVERYRALYNGVGGQWHWADRRLMNDDELRREITHPLVDIMGLNVAGEMAGYAELDRRKWPDIQIAYFGLMPAFIGRGLGGAFLDAVLEQAWNLGPSRVWLHTCSLDHPSALPMYRSAGFREFGTERRKQRLIAPETDAGMGPEIEPEIEE